METSNFGEKASFVVALFAAFIALNFYSQYFEKIQLNFGIYDYPLIWTFNIMLFLLFICVYFYAIDYASKSFSRFSLLNWFKKAGNFFFVFSLILLPLAVIISLLSQGINFLGSLYGSNFLSISFLLSIISSVAGILVSFITGKAISNIQKNDLIEKMRSEEEKIIRNIEKLYKQGFYSSAIIEMGKLIEIVLQKRISDKTDIDTRKYSLYNLLDIALSKKIINKNLIDSIKKIRMMRNKAAHLSVDFNKKDTKQLFEEITKILDSLDSDKKS